MHTGCVMCCNVQLLKRVHATSASLLLTCWNTLRFGILQEGARCLAREEGSNWANFKGRARCESVSVSAGHIWRSPSPYPSPPLPSVPWQYQTTAPPHFFASSLSRSLPPRGPSTYDVCDGRSQVTLLHSIHPITQFTIMDVVCSSRRYKKRDPAFG